MEFSVVCLNVIDNVDVDFLQENRTVSQIEPQISIVDMSSEEQIGENVIDIEDFEGLQAGDIAFEFGINEKVVWCDSSFSFSPENSGMSRASETFDKTASDRSLVEHEKNCIDDGFVIHDARISPGKSMFFLSFFI